MIRTCPKCGTKNRLSPSRLHETADCGKCGARIGPPDQPSAIGSADEFDTLIQEASLPVLVDFWAAWCGPCKAVAPELEKLAKEKAGKVVVAKLDTDAFPDVAGRYQIRGIPAFIL